MTGVAGERRGALDTTSSDASNERRRRRLAGPVHWWFHGLLVLPVVALLWSVSVPGWDFFLGVGAGWVLVGFVVVWCARGFYEGTALFDEAGFAYLPDGPTAEVQQSLESPTFRSLGGGWYAFTARW